MDTKLSELMEQGAKDLYPYASDYFSPDKKAACALGCAIWAVNKGKFEGWGIEQVYSMTTDAINVIVDISQLPKDIREHLDYILHDPINQTITLHDVITGTNDNVSRERAIQLVKELGY